jgi:5-methylcytosine-specific restriction endonuclease McrA
MFNNYSIVDMINAGIKPYHLRETKTQVKIAKVKIVKVKKGNRMRRPYYKLVWKITNSNAVYLKDIELRAWKGKHVEHIVPISYGEKHNIPAELIGSLENLVMLDRKENMKKGKALSAQSKELLKTWGYELS